MHEQGRMGRAEMRTATPFKKLAIQKARDSKKPRPVSRRGLNSCDDEHMPVICPTCQIS
jgi:hypothetical protein